MRQTGIAVALILGFLISGPLTAEPITLLDSGGTLLRFIDSNAPSVSLGTVVVTGMQPTETLAAIDYRPATGVLYGVGVLPTGPAQLYTIDTTTGLATLVGAGPFHPTIGLSQIGMDFNPVVDRIRLISNVGFNLRVNPDDGTALTDTSVAFAPGDPNETNDNSPLGLAYSNNNVGAVSTTLYGIVLTSGPTLVTVGSVNGTPTSPNTGLMFTVGATGLGGYNGFRQGFDISPSGVAFAVVDSNNILYAINLGTGQATAVGSLPLGSAIMGLSASGAIAAEDAVPFLNPWMLVALAMLLAAVGGWVVRN